MKLYEYVIRRILLLFPVLLGVLLITFYISRIILDPTAAYVTEKTPESAIPAIRKQLGLDQPFPVQFAIYIKDLFTLNWGWSKTAHDTVINAIADHFPATVELTIFAFLLTIGIGIPIGIVSALRSNSLVDHAIRFTALVGISTPVFWLALMLQYIFTYWTKNNGLPYLPSTGRYDPILILSHPVQKITGLMILDSLIQGNWIMAWDAFNHLILPAITLSFLNIGVIARITRSSFLEVLRQDYISAAKAYGLPERRIYYKYALKNAMIPVTTISGLMFGGMLGGAVITETIFAFPGMGWLSVRAITYNDSATILGFTVLATFIYVFTNLVVDIIYAWLDPRIKY
ncbi:MAG: ABC transporter permease [Thermoprotei archaeon]